MNAKRSVEAMRALVEEHIDRKKSPMRLWLSGRLLSVNYGFLAMEFNTRKEMTDATGKMHGGVISTLIEEVIGLMVNSARDDANWRCSDMMVKFVRSIELGQQVKVEAFINSEKDNILEAQARVFDSFRQLIAIGRVRLEKP